MDQLDKKDKLDLPVPLGKMEKREVRVLVVRADHLAQVDHEE